MPADAEELEMAVEDGVEFCELLAPVRLEAGKLVCKVMKLGISDASGRGVLLRPVNLRKWMRIVIVAVGEKSRRHSTKQTDYMYPSAEGLSMKKHWNQRGRGVYVVGDGLGGSGYGSSRESATVRWPREAIIGKKSCKRF